MLVSPERLLSTRISPAVTQLNKIQLHVPFLELLINRYSSVEITTFAFTTFVFSINMFRSLCTVDRYSDRAFPKNKIVIIIASEQSHFHILALKLNLYTISPHDTKWGLISIVHTYSRIF